MKVIQTPFTREQAQKLCCGEKVRISGVIYTARDAAHKKMTEALAAGEALPFDLKDQIIYFVGPTPAPPGRVIGAAGPTTSGRMDAYSPLLIAQGLTGMIGKGLRTQPVVEALKQYGGVYFGAVGGAGALLSSCIKEARVIAYPELGTEALRRLVVEDFPAIVLLDGKGEDLYKKGRESWQIK